MAMTAGDSGGSSSLKTLKSVGSGKNYGGGGASSAQRLPSNMFADLGIPNARAPIANPYRAPAMAQPAPVRQNTPTFGVGAPSGGGMGDAPIPEPQAKPVMSESDWLAGDGEYQNQMTEYDNSLKDFLARLTTQENDFTTDYNTAKTGLGRNRDRGMLNLGEDFTSRGLANSGLFNNERETVGQNFKDQETGLDSAKSRAFADFGNQRTDKTKATDQAKGNAKRSSLGRMSQAQMF